ncbi:MtnX-like HAD-IB family phosphatase [Rouxiella sp. Mn2063]|uniref:MtnX-like HAD-IB family phosphatase n=1 Tax=Rouxiella sp. Mn2063 TaxID=3395262 RepID=UPI003BD52D19
MEIRTFSSMAMPWTIYCDFDGTISTEDITDTLLDTFGMPGWQALEQRWVAGEIGSQDCMSGQIALLDASTTDLHRCLDSIHIDPDFAEFVRYVKAQHIALNVVSDGLDYAINYLLQRHGISGLPVFANQLLQISERRWSLNFPHYQQDCRKASGTCKCAIAGKTKTAADNSVMGKSLLIGDGRSDFCVSRQVEHVFAKDSLIRECQKNGTSFTPIDDFSQAAEHLQRLLANDVSGAM